ncbi:hypothetical protein SteCoe_11369 [Stentor coeruleus]|uniref:Uncharacterized protein n=1 Tax=Stentor coeruleus TaxID=5963 RepID=A0A1R2CD72_9CILI|nr:hypothetical protein SteCoe_11369 [Stentor coeruleus]
MSGKDSPMNANKAEEIVSKSPSPNKKHEKYSKSPLRGDKTEGKSPDCKKNNKSSSRLQKPPIDNKDLDSRKSPIALRYDYIKGNIDRIKKVSSEIDIPDLQLAEMILNDTLESKLSQSPSKERRSKGHSRERSLEQSPRILQQSGDLLFPIKDPEIYEKIEKGYMATLKNLEIKDLAICELLKPKKSYEKIQIAEEEKKTIVRRNSSSKMKHEKIERSPIKRTASKPQERPGSCELITTSLKSQEVLANKFIKEFEKIIKELEIQNEEIDLNDTITVLTKLEFINNEPGTSSFDNEVSQVDKLWRTLGGITTVKVSSLLTMCLHVMNLYKSNSYFTDTNCHNIKTWSLVNGIYVYSQEEALKIHKNFFSFYQNRRLGYKKRQLEEKPLEDCPFKPTINSASEVIAYETREKLGAIGSQKREEYLQLKKIEIEQKREKIKNKKEENEISECTFKPTVNNSFNKTSTSDMFNNTIEKPPIVKEKPIKTQSPSKALRERPQEERKRASSKNLQSPNKFNQSIEKSEINLEGYFHPNLEKNKAKEQSEGFYSEKVQKEIQRMRKIREEKNKKAQKLEIVSRNIHKRTNSFNEDKNQTVSPEKNTSFITSTTQNRPAAVNRHKSSHNDKNTVEKVKNRKNPPVQIKKGSGSDRKSEEQSLKSEEIAFDRQGSYDKNQECLEFITYDVEVVKNSDVKEDIAFIPKTQLDENKAEVPFTVANDCETDDKRLSSSFGPFAVASDRESADKSLCLREGSSMYVEEIEDKMHIPRESEDIIVTENDNMIKGSLEEKSEIKNENMLQGNYQSIENNSHTIGKSEETMKKIETLEEQKSEKAIYKQKDQEEEKNINFTPENSLETNKNANISNDKHQDLLEFIKTHNLPTDSYEKLKEIFMNK